MHGNSTKRLVHLGFVCRQLHISDMWNVIRCLQKMVFVLILTMPNWNPPNLDMWKKMKKKQRSYIFFNEYLRCAISQKRLQKSFAYAWNLFNTHVTTFKWNEIIKTRLLWNSLPSKFSTNHLSNRNSLIDTLVSEYKIVTMYSFEYNFRDMKKKMCILNLVPDSLIDMTLFKDTSVYVCTTETTTPVQLSVH